MIVLVHGVPETASIWDEVRTHLDSPSLALPMPGFGCPRPDGFGATKDDYVDWLVGELDKIDEPVDLVGHDWGGGLSIRVGMKYPDKVRSWASDVAPLLHPNYVWHDFAQIWQTPEEGEKFFEGQLAAGAEANVPTYQMFGLVEAGARKLANMGDETMAACILDLYRSATPNVHKDWSDVYGSSTKPALVIISTEDAFIDGDKAREVADVFGAQTASLPAGHFWPLQVPEAGAAVINEFVASVA